MKKSIAFIHTLVTATAFALAVSAPLQAEQVLRFGTGGSDGSYFPIGSLIAGQINKLFDGCCGSDRLLLLPQRSNGSVSNIKEISSDLLDLGLAQADIVSLAYQGIGQFDGDDLKDELRTIGTLFQESVHLVVGVHSGIDSVKDLVGKLVSVDELGSGTQFDVELILKASDISSDQVKPVYLKPTESMERMRRGQLDAIFVVSAYPVAGVKQLVEDGIGRVIGLGDELVKQLASEQLYFSSQSIPANVYSNNEEISTLSVSAQMIVSSEIEPDTVYDITRTLWSDSTLAALAEGHIRGGEIVAGKALQGVGIPIHEGALRYYREQGYNLSDVPK